VGKVPALSNQILCRTAGRRCRESSSTPDRDGRVHRVDGEHGANEWCPPTGDRGNDRSRDPADVPLVGLDTYDGGEFINHALNNCPGDCDLFFTMARPYKSKDNAPSSRRTVTWCADMRSIADTTQHSSSNYWTTYRLVRARLNLLTETTKALGLQSNTHGEKARRYYTPLHPRACGLLIPASRLSVKPPSVPLFDLTNPAKLTRKQLSSQPASSPSAKTKPARLPATSRKPNQLRHAQSSRAS